MKILAFAGQSGSGKTTLICELIAHLVARGASVAAIKHTHHPLNRERRGDTACFLDAGAKAAILADDESAILPNGNEIAYETPDELLRHLDADVVFIEGFKRFAAWPRLDVHHDARPSLAEVLLILSNQ